MLQAENMRLSAPPPAELFIFGASASRKSAKGEIAECKSPSSSAAKQPTPSAEAGQADMFDQQKELLVAAHQAEIVQPACIGESGRGPVLVDDPSEELPILRRRCEALQEENTALLSRLANSTQRCGALEEEAAISAAKLSQLDAALSASRASASVRRHYSRSPAVQKDEAMSAASQGSATAGRSTSADGEPGAHSWAQDDAATSPRRRLDAELELAGADCQLADLEQRCRELEESADKSGLSGQHALP